MLLSRTRNHILSLSLFLCLPSSYSSSSSFSASSSIQVVSLVTKIGTRVGFSRVNPPTCQPRVVIATMSTAATVSQQPEHLQHSETGSSDKQPQDHSQSRSRPESLSSHRDSTKSSEPRFRIRPQSQKSGAKRMSGFFPLGYKEAVYQWVSRTTTNRRIRVFLSLETNIASYLVDSCPSYRLRTKGTQLRPVH